MWGFRYWLDVLLLLALGVLGAYSVIFKKRPEAGELIGKLMKVSGYIGLLAFLWGIYRLVDVLATIETVSVVPLMWLTWLAISVEFVTLGFIFGYGLAAFVLSEQARAKVESLRGKLAGYQITLGWVSLGLAAWVIIYRFIIFRVPGISA